MRLLKLAILSFILLFILITIISLFIPANIRISKATNIAADDTVIFKSIGYLSSWKFWHPALKNLNEKDFSVSNDSMVSVLGTTIALQNKSDSVILTSISRENGRPLTSGFNLLKHPESDSSTLQWYMDFNLRWYPWEKFKSLFYESIYGVQMEEGLSNLKQLNFDAVRH